MLCPICDYTSDTYARFRAHLTLFHDNVTPCVIACRELGCEVNNYHSLYGFLKHAKGHFQILNNEVNGRDNVNGGAMHDDAAEIPGDIDNNVLNDDVGVGDNGDMHHDEGAHQENEFSLDYFVNNHYDNLKLFVAHLYASPNVSRKTANNLLKSTSELFYSSVSLLKRNVFQLLSTCTGDDEFADSCSKVDQMFSVLENPFDQMHTEYRRFSELERQGVFIKPQSYLMGHVDDYKKDRNGVQQLVRTPAYGQFVPLRNSLKTYLELPGIFDAIMNYRAELQNNGTVISDFIQGELWRELSVDDSDAIVLPIFLHFDDYEPDNSLGSHHGDNSLGALYSSLGCLPPKFRASLDNLFVVALFKSKHRKIFGNAVTFGIVITELTFLEENGISVVTALCVRRVMFRFSLIIADNAGNNAIQGFVESFRGNFYCRLCKMHRDTISHNCLKVPDALLRSVLNYQEDVLQNDISTTGIKELCVWNQVPSYDCIRSRNCEVLHDFYEGALKYDLCEVLFHLISTRGYFGIDELKERIDGFVYGPTECGNKPPTSNLSVDCLRNSSWNLSASERLCLFRNLGEMISDLIPVNCGVWRLYQILYEILLVVTAPTFDTRWAPYLDVLVSEHHELYLYYFGLLKPKHHFMSHYSAILIRNGPVVALSALPLERKHRFGKMYAKSCFSRVNFPLSVAIKHQLSLCDLFLKSCNVNEPQLNMTRIKYLPLTELQNFELYQVALNVHAGPFCVPESVTLFGTTYKVGMSLVVDNDGILPTFAKIIHVIVLENKSVKFVLRVFKTVCFKTMCCSYQVQLTNDFVVKSHSDLVSFVPLWARTCVSGENICITLRNGL